MSIARATGFIFLFRSLVYVFGGFTANKCRSKKIECYDPSTKTWQILNIKMHRGIEQGCLHSFNSNEILIFGGNMHFGSLKSVIKVNLCSKSYIR